MSRPKPDSPCARKVFPSPNHGERTKGAVTSLILHYTGMPTGAAALERLCNPLSEVSCHYFVWEDGNVLQLVPEARRAWHAGRSFWAGEHDINSRSIGIEIVNPGPDGGSPRYPPQQIAALIALCRDICARHALEPRHVLAHSDIAPARKQDPGEWFPWDQLHKAGIGHWVPPTPLQGGRFLSRSERGQPVEALQAMLAFYGYGVPVSGIYDEETQQVVAAFQRHFRPQRVDGVADASTILTLRDLIRALPMRADDTKEA